MFYNHWLFCNLLNLRIAQLTTYIHSLNTIDDSCNKYFVVQNFTYRQEQSLTQHLDLCNLHEMYNIKQVINYKVYSLTMKFTTKGIHVPI